MPPVPTPAMVAAAREALADADPALARAHAQTPVFEWRQRPGGYEGLFHIIVDQQVSVAAAASITGSGPGRAASAGPCGASPVASRLPLRVQKQR